MKNHNVIYGCVLMHAFDIYLNDDDDDDDEEMNSDIKYRKQKRITTSLIKKRVFIIKIQTRYARLCVKSARNDEKSETNFVRDEIYLIKKRLDEE